MSGRKGKSSLSSSSSSTTSTSTKEELLLQSKLAREARTLHRHRTIACTKIQAIYRRILSTRHAQTRVMADLQEKVTSLLTTTDIRQMPIPNLRLQQMLRQFLFASSLQTTGFPTPLLEYLVCMVLVSLMKGSGDNNYLTLAMKSTTWVFQLTRFLETVIESLLSASVDTSLSSPYLLLINTCTNRTLYTRALMENGDKIWRSVLYGLGGMISTRCGTFQALKQLVERGEDNQIAHVIVGVASQSLSCATSEHEQTNIQATQVLQQSGNALLITPQAIASSVVQRLISSVTPHRHEQAHLWSVMIKSLSPTRQKWSWAQCAIVIGNLMDVMLQNNFDSTLVRFSMKILPTLISISHMEWAFDAKLTVSTEKHDAYDRDEDDMFFSSNVSAELATAIESTICMEERSEARNGWLDLQHRNIEHVIKMQWQQWCNADFIHGLVRVASTAAQDESLTAMCRIYSMFLIVLGRSNFFSIRQSYNPPSPAISIFLNASIIAIPSSSHQTSPSLVIHRLWSLIKMRQQKWDDSIFPPFLLFNILYSFILLTVDDETFYDQSWPFTTSQVIEIIQYLKHFIYETSWNTSSSPPFSLLVFSTFTTGVKLFNQLYDRDCRRRFTTDGTWLWSGMPPIKEVVDLESMEGEELYEIHALYTLFKGTSISLHHKLSLVLTTIPQIFSFTERIQLFETLLEAEKTQMHHVRDEFSRAIQVRIKRDEIVDNSYELFRDLCKGTTTSILKGRIKVSFINEQGLEEAGIDGGGVFKEYVDTLTKKAFSPEYGFFLTTSEQLLYPNPAAHLLVETPIERLHRFRFLGQVLGKAVYENILVEPQFTCFFLNKLLGRWNDIDDLASLDPELYRHVLQLKHYDGDVEALGLTFSLNMMEYGQIVTKELVPNGMQIPVTHENRIRYIHLLAHYKLNMISLQETNAFLRGFRDLIPAKWIQLFNPTELQMLIGGQTHQIDVQDWQQHTTYGGGYHPSQPMIQWFWELLYHEFTMEECSLLLKFITSCSRQPLLGFQQLSPQICIYQVRQTDDQRLPSSATCMNLLKLPTYSTKTILKNKLLYAIKSNAGFDLS